MNSRERVLCAMEHRTPDRVPIDLGATRQTGIAASTYARLREHLGLDTSRRVRVYDVFQFLAEVERQMLDRFGADLLGVQPRVIAFGIETESFRPWELFDGTPVEVPVDFRPEVLENGDLLLRKPDGSRWALMPQGGFYFDRVDQAPGAEHVDPESFQPPRLTEADVEHMRLQAEAYRQNTDKAVIVRAAPAQELFFGMGIGDFSHWMITLATEPDYVRALYEKLVEAWIADLELLHAHLGDLVDFAQFNDDLGTQNGPFLSPKMFEELVMPYYRRGLDWIHAHTSWKVFMHSCGAIADFMPLLIEMGVDAINPVQLSAKGMDPAMLKEKFGDRIAFWGGACDCQRTLPFGTPEEVAAEVERNVRILGADGGLIVGGVHNIQANVPPENVVALFDTARNVPLS